MTSYDLINDFGLYISGQSMTFSGHGVHSPVRIHYDQIFKAIGDPIARKVFMPAWDRGEDSNETSGSKPLQKVSSG